MTDDELIIGCIQEDESCQRELFRRYAGRMLGVCHRYARSTADAEDIVQDAFIKVFEKIYQFKSEGSFEGWIRKIVVNTALKKYRFTPYFYKLRYLDNHIRCPKAFIVSKVK